MKIMKRAGRPLSWVFDPLEALSRWPLDRSVLMLHSGRLDRRWARWSVFASPVGTYRFVGLDTKPSSGIDRAQPSGRSQWLGPTGSCPIDRFSHKPFADLRELLNQSKGIWIGYLGYDLGRWAERFTIGSATAQDDRGWPIIELGYCPGYLVHDGLTGSWTACGLWADPASRCDRSMPDLARGQAQQVHVAATTLSHFLDQPAYEHAVAVAKQYIAAGDTFQVNLAHRLTAHLSSDPPLGRLDPRVSRSLYGQLASVSPAWYGAYLELAPVDADGSSQAVSLAGRLQRAVLSTSPELFLRVDGRRVVTRPVKGTRPASVDPVRLRDSAKDTAELNMIIDLMRNDLGRVCEYGSVRVTQRRTIESHPTVHHGVATVEGRLHRSKTVVDLLRAAFPAGSITGAPKVRSMQIIDELEPVRRGPYCGCIGYLGRDQAHLSVAIRTGLADLATGRVDFSVGGGVVADSHPAAEYQETLDKAAAVMSALGLGPLSVAGGG